jgi:hypothetical protein
MKFSLFRAFKTLQTAKINSTSKGLLADTGMPPKNNLEENVCRKRNFS